MSCTMIKKVYFFDSYAIIEIIKGNANYYRYADATIVTTKLNLFEVYYTLLKLHSEKDADKFLERSSSFVIDYDLSIIKEAAIMKLTNQKKNISLTDCIGYCTALKLRIPFLTGDKEFEHFKNVTFVK